MLLKLLLDLVLVHVLLVVQLVCEMPHFRVTMMVVLKVSAVQLERRDALYSLLIVHLFVLIDHVVVGVATVHVEAMLNR